MERHPILSQAPAEAAHIPLYPKPFRKSRHFGAFLICCALFVAGFALTALWRNTDGNLWGKKDPNQTPPENTVEEDPHLEEEESPEEKPIPEGATRIVSRDLSYIEKGMEYLNNQTAYHPNIPELLQRDIQGKHTQEPLVLVLHTHTSEGYLSENCTYFDGDVGEQTYTQEEARNMLAIGKAFVAALNKNGITASHCTVMHDAAGLAGS